MDDYVIIGTSLSSQHHLVVMVCTAETPEQAIDYSLEEFPDFQIHVVYLGDDVDTALEEYFQIRKRLH